jgi:alpha-1,3/alpha-1,6-mannosyltransferase
MALVVQVLFYCHYPDKLLCVRRQSLLKRLYRFPLDWLEEVTTGQQGRH